MHVSFEKENDFLHVILSGEIDMYCADKLKKSIDGAFDKYCARNISFDMTNVSFIDSSGLGVIMGRYRRIASLGGIVVIFGANDRLYRILELSGITRLMRVHRRETDRRRSINE